MKISSVAGISCRRDSDACGQAQARAQKLDQALVGDAAEVFEQIAVVAEVRAEHLGDAEHEMPCGTR